ELSPWAFYYKYKNKNQKDDRFDGYLRISVIISAWTLCRGN
ncbi:uncharacterized protein METZ01_LOCUS220045, partial [marine metagenome]